MDYDFPETVGNVIIPTEFNSFIFQRGGEKPPTRCFFSASKAIWMKPGIMAENHTVDGCERNPASPI